MIADAICCRIARSESLMPVIWIIVSNRPRASRGRVGVNRGQRTIVTGIHRLQHIDSPRRHDLADDDAIGSHTQCVLDQVALVTSPLPSMLGGVFPGAQRAAAASATPLSLQS
jgi:hypothetical protein